MNVAERDQIQAAADDAQRRALAAVARRDDWSASPRGGPIAAAILGRFATALAASGTHCGHIDAPRPCIGHAWTPGHVMCDICAVAATKTITGTPDDHVCDGCGKRADMLSGGCTFLGPVAVLYGLCDGCRRAERDGRR